MHGRLGAPVVPPEAYDEAYFLECCAGAEEWAASGGARPAGLYLGSLMRAGLREGEVLVDIGTGRGELLAVAVEHGAARAIGVEYAPAAVALARRTLEVHNVGSRAEVLEADARCLPLDDEVADLVTLLDVVEHLAPSELDAVLSEARRVLRPGGRVFVHTMPNRTIYEITYRLQRAARPSRWRSWPRDPRGELERRLHVNEQSLRSLRRALRRAGFHKARVVLGEWVYCEFVPDASARALYHRLARHRLTARFGVGDLWAEGTRPARAGSATRPGGASDKPRGDGKLPTTRGFAGLRFTRRARWS